MRLMNDVYANLFCEKLKEFILKRDFLMLAVPCLACFALMPGCFQQSAPERKITALSLEEAATLADKVEFINLSRGAAVDVFPSGLDKFPVLQKLSVRGQARCASVPEEVGKLKNLQMLDLSETGAKTLPDSFGAMSGLRHLYLSGNAMTNFPVQVCALEGLGYLNLDRNEIASIPDEVGQMKGLKWLRLNFNKLQSLPAGAAELKNVKRLYLRGNSFTNFPKVILEMTSLEELDLGKNKIKELPEAIMDMPNLHRIDLDGNPIEKLPAAIGTMKGLRWLFLNKCAIPEEEQKRVREAFPDKVKVHIAF